MWTRGEEEGERPVARRRRRRPIRDYVTPAAEDQPQRRLGRQGRNFIFFLSLTSLYRKHNNHCGNFAFIILTFKLKKNYLGSFHFLKSLS